jgi:hypothetical protein
MQTRKSDTASTLTILLESILDFVSEKTTTS